MNEIQQGVLILVKSALTGKAGMLPEGFSVDEAESIIICHQIVGMAYEGAVLCGIDKKSPVMQRLFQKYYQQILCSEKQMAAITKLFAVFEENGIDYLPVKGANMKLMYPDHAMRVMGDADVLIRMEQYDKIKILMEQLGYSAGHEIDHEIVWDSPALHLELHKRLIPSDDKDYYGYIGEGWEYAVAQSGTRYTFSDEVMFVFLLLHFAKHYRSGGIGLRQAIDLWLFEQKTPMDRELLFKELKKVNMTEFYQNIHKMLECWFEDGELDEKSDFISEYLFSSGSWGTVKNKLIGQGLKKSKKSGSVAKTKLKMVWKAAFPPLSSMKKRYNILNGCPFLLPFYYLVRWIGAIFTRQDNIRNYANNIQLTSNQNIDTFEKSLHYVGLHYDI